MSLKDLIEAPDSPTPPIASPPGMSTLSDLIQADSPAPTEARPMTPVEKHKIPAVPPPEETHVDPVEELLKNQEIPETPLGIAVDNFMTNWNQLLLLINTTVGHTQPSLDHIKEVAECAAKNLKDSCLELSGEFTRASLQWRLNERDEAIQDEIADYDAAIKRQGTIIARTAGVISRHLAEYPSGESRPS